MLSVSVVTWSQEIEFLIVSDRVWTLKTHVNTLVRSASDKDRTSPDWIRAPGSGDLESLESLRKNSEFFSDGQFCSFDFTESVL